MATTDQPKLATRLLPAEHIDGSLDALDLLLILARKRRTILIATLLGVVSGVVLAFSLRPSFTAATTILPPQQQSSSAALLNQLGSLASLGTGTGALNLKTPSDMYVGMLQSRTIADNLISTFHLPGVYNKRNLQDTRKALKKHTSINTGKDGLIEVSVVDHDPQRASDLANAYVEQLDRLNSSLAVNEASQRRLFFEQQLEAERKSLTRAEDDLRATQQKTGLIQITGQAEVIIQSIAQLRAEIASREVKLQSLRSFATDQNPDVARLQGELATMRGQLSKMESEQQHASQPGDISVPSGNLPKDSLEYARNLREVKYHESLFDLLSKQEEAARIDEAKSAPIIQVVDHAIPPDKRSGPPRLLIILGLTVLGFAIGALFAIAGAMIARLREAPQHRARLESLALHLRRF